MDIALEIKTEAYPGLINRQLGWSEAKLNIDKTPHLIPSRDLPPSALLCLSLLQGAQGC